MPFTDASEALDALKTHLQTRLDTDYSATFSNYGGVDVVLQDVEPDEVSRVGRPYLLLNVGGDDLAPDSPTEGGQRNAIIDAQAVAVETNGAKVGNANPVGVDTLLGRALVEIIREDYITLRDAGLTRMQCIPGREIIEAETDNRPVTHRNPYRLTFTYFTP